jgi:hypothetical protein
MAVAHTLARLKREPFADLPIAADLDQVCKQCNHVWRDRLLTPLITIRLFVLQVLNGNTAITHLRHLIGIDFTEGSYCEARQRLPLEVFTSLLKTMLNWAQRIVPQERTLGQRVLIVDSSNFSMSDTPKLRKHFGLPQNTKTGVSFPLAKILGLLDLASGLFVEMIASPLFVHEMRGVTGVHDALQSGDILLGDRAFCSWTHFALLNLKGVFACFRLHQNRQPKALRGRERWDKPKNVPVWMTEKQFASLPAWLEVRLFIYRIEAKGFRSKQVTVATTLLDETLWPDAKLMELYGQRWKIETCFNHLKTTMKMNVLKCQSVDGVLKELAVYLLVYNLVRLAMLKAAQDRKVTAERISFIDALRWLSCRMLGLCAVARLIVNPARPGRSEPRALRRRLKPYDLLNCPRAEWKKAQKSGTNA